MPKRPSFQFYPGDWLRDSVAGCSLAAQGLWLRMMILAHDTEKYGYLVQNGAPTPLEAVARRCGCAVEQFNELLQELDRAGVPSRTREGIIYSRRMVRDESLREIRASGGPQSLNNPKVARPKNKKDGVKDGGKDTRKDGHEGISEASSCEGPQLSLGVSPSSSSSCSSSNQKVKTNSSTPDGADQSVLGEEFEPMSLDSGLETVWSYYMAELSRDAKQYTWTEKREAWGKARLRDLKKRSGSVESAVALMKLCIDRLKQRPFNNGANPEGKKYIGWEHLFDSTERMEMWLNDDNFTKEKANGQ